MFLLFILDVLSKIISIYVITRPCMSQHPSTLNEEERNSFPAFSHVTLLLARSGALPFYLVCSSRRRLPCVAKLKSTILPFIKFDLLQQNKQKPSNSIEHKRKKIVSRNIKSAFVVVINKETRCSTTKRSNLILGKNEQKVWRREKNLEGRVLNRRNISIGNRIAAKVVKGNRAELLRLCVLNVI